MISLCVVAVYVGGGKTNGVDGASSPRRSSAVQRDESPSVVDDEPVPEDAMRISSIDVHNNHVGISLSFPTNLVDEGNTIDVLFNRELSQEGWEWATNRIVCADDIGTDVVGRIEFALGFGVEIPDGLSRLFFKASVRETVAVTMADGDGDGIPDAYELFHGTNPYLYDYELSPRITVGADGDYRTIRAALAASGQYSIIEVTENVNEDIPIQMPPHPVMITGPTNGYAVVRGRSAPGVFILSDSQDERTVFRNLYLMLDAKTNFQSGFWVGGNLPWYGTGAGGTFRNVRIRMPHSQTEYFGWHFYRYTCVTSEISRCVIDASGAGWAFGIYGMDPPPMAIDGCSFLNFGSGGVHDGIGICLLNSQFGLNQGDPAAISVRNTLFDDSFVDAVPIARFDGDAGVTLAVNNCLMPTNSIYGDPPEELSRLMITNALVSHFGHPLPESPAVGLGIGALGVFPLNGQDTDGDGLNDYDEVYVHGTDPWFSDTDCDGFSDGAELAHGTDPADADSFYRAITYSITGCDGIANVTNSVCWSTSPDGWQGATEVREFDTATSSGAYDVMTDTGTIYLKAYRDFNRNGVYDSGVEPMIVRGVGLGVNVAHIDAVFCDVDGDKITDLQEFADGTSPTDGGEYAFNLDLMYTDVFRTTNSLTFSVNLGSAIVYPPTVVTNRTWHQDFLHLVATTGEHVVVSVWDDANSNQHWDEVETGNQYTINIKEHDMVQTNTLSYGNFDRDRNNLLDWWEIHTGLTTGEDSADEYADPDGDGLINLHEFWAGADPLVPDGSNTFVWALAHSIDERIKGKVSSTSTMELYTDYTISYNALTNELSLTVTPNADAWVYGLDFSAVGICSKYHGATTIAHGLFPTAISDRHVIFAKHCNARTNDCYRFRTPDGIYTNLHLAGFAVHPNASYDLMVGILDGALPPSIKPVKFLPSDYRSYIGSGQRLPTLRLNQWAHASVQEIENLPSFSSPRADVIFRFSEDPQRTAFFKDVLWGDSGHPSFFLCGDDLIFLFTAYHTPDWRRVTAVPAISLKDEIEEMMNRLSADFNVTNLYQVQEYDFTKYRLENEE